MQKPVLKRGFGRPARMDEAGYRASMTRKPEQDFTDWHDDYAPGYKLTAFVAVVVLIIAAAASAWVF